MSTITTKRATLDDLYKVEGKAELIGGRIVHYMAAGELPGTVALEIAVSLRQHSKQRGGGRAYGDNVGYAVPELQSGRESFAPDASGYDGPLPLNRMRFIDGPPTLAVEVRSENDYKPGADADMAAKRADYIEAGTLVVWDVDPLAELVHVYRADQPAHCTTFRRGDTADAEPAVPSWRMAVDEIFA